MAVFDQTGLPRRGTHETQLERQQFFDGQRLLASDLQGLEAFHRQMRELHNRSLHQPGIGNGFAVSGERGDRQVTIGAGYALDSEGHEIVLTASRIEPVPPVASADDGGPVFFHLTVSYPSGDDLEESETRRGLCQTHGTVRLREEPVFCWVRLIRDGTGLLRPADPHLEGDIREGRKIVLARLEIRDCRLEKPPHVAQRRNARPATQPRIVCGRVETPAWTLTEIPGEDDCPPNPALAYFLTAPVDTRHAGFLTTPCYTARIDGPRLIDVSALAEADTDEFFVDGLISIEKTTPEGFDARVSLVTEQEFVLDAVAPDPFLVSQLFLQWSIEWMAIE